MKTFKVITLFQLETLYRIMLYRIAKGYSAGQLAFLIGAAPQYVEEVEAFQRPFYTGDDLERTALALGESSVQNLFPSVDNNNEFLILIHKQNFNGKWIHTFCSVDEKNEEEELFRLREDIDPSLDDLPNGDDVLVLLTSMKTLEPFLWCLNF
jgi:transcriptional regulator with XRE-family HTH domain